MKPSESSEHIAVCRACGATFDMRDLDQVFYHEEPDHKPIPHDSVAWYAPTKIMGEKIENED